MRDDPELALGVEDDGDRFEEGGSDGPAATEELDGVVGRVAAPGGQAEAGAEGVAQALGGGLEKVVEEVAALAENLAQHFRDGEDELAVRDFVADGGDDPGAGLAGAALVAGGAEGGAAPHSKTLPRRSGAPSWWDS